MLDVERVRATSTREASITEPALHGQGKIMKSHPQGNFYLQASSKVLFALSMPLEKTNQL